jgi:hypothetical protein
MHTYEQKPKTALQTTFARGKIPPRAHLGQSRTANSILHSQRTIGNQTKQRLVQPDTGRVEGDSTTIGHANLGYDFRRIPVHAPAPKAVQPQLSFAKGDEESIPAPITQEQPVTMPPRIPPMEPTLAPEETVSGTIPDIITPPEEGRQTGEEEFTEDSFTEDSFTLGRAGNVAADIRLAFSQLRTDGRIGRKHDPVVSGVSVGAFSQPNGRAVSPFGSEFYEPAFTGISWGFASGKCTISATLDVVCPWGTNAGGRTDVPSATDAVVTKTKWPDIKADLQPGPASPFKSPRTVYYSKSLVERHEKFHGTDDEGWTSASGLGIVKAHLEAGTVAPATAAADVATLVDAARVKLISENIKWYKGGGAAHDSYAGEIRAYAHGKASYQKLADDVEAHGKSLP